MLGYLSLDIICSSKLTVFLELRSRKTVRFSGQIMSADKYPSIFSRQMKAIVYIVKYIYIYIYIIMNHFLLDVCCYVADRLLEIFKCGSSSRLKL